MPPIRSLSRGAMLVLVALACGGGGGDGPTGPGPGPGPGPSPSPNTVTLGASSFSPASITIQTGGTVTWRNSSGITHNVTFNPVTGAPANIGDHSSGDNSRTFGTGGTFGYQCTLHGGMTGSVVVQ